MTRMSFQESLTKLQQDLLEMGSLVEKAIHNSIKSLAEKDLALAESVIQDDDVVDKMQIEIEQRCLTLIALQQPMASDLRKIGTALKIVTDLERIGDHAVDIAKISLRLGNQPLIKPLIDIPRMTEIAKKMIRESLTAYVQYDAELVLDLARQDDDIDHLYSQIFRELLVFMMEDPKTITQATHLLMVARSLERIADHATNIGEWVYYMVTGERKGLN